MEEEVIPHINFIPYPTAPEALAKIAAIDAKYQREWEQRSTETYANPIERTGVFYLPVVSGYQQEFTAEELFRGVEVLPA